MSRVSDVVTALERSAEEWRKSAEGQSDAGASDAAVHFYAVEEGARYAVTIAKRYLNKPEETTSGIIHAVFDLHAPVAKDFTLSACVVGQCEHDLDGDCPIVPIDVCAECWRLVDTTGVDWHEKNAPADVIYPCPTAKAMGA